MGSPWVGDKSQFGYKMLLKMGWKDGNGLGANQDGTVKPIVAAKNVENRGIGAKRTSDNWIHGASDFEKLLKRLNEANSSNTDTKQDENGASSTEKSTTSTEEVNESKEDEVVEQEEQETQRRGPRMRYTRMLKAKGIIRSEHSADRLAEVLAVTRKEQLNVYIADSDSPAADEPQDGARQKKAKKARANEALETESTNQQVKKDNDEAEIDTESKEATKKNKKKKKTNKQKPAGQEQIEEQEKQSDEEEQPAKLSKKERKALRKLKKEKESENQE